MTSSSSAEFVPSSLQGEEVTSCVSPPTSPTTQVSLPAESGEPFVAALVPVVAATTRRRLPDWGCTSVIEHQPSYPSSSRSKLSVRRPRGRYAPQGRVASYRPTMESRNPSFTPSPTNLPLPPSDQLTKCSICQDTSKSTAFVNCDWCANFVVHSFCIPNMIGRRRRFWLCDVCVTSCARSSEDCIEISDPPPPPAPTNHPPLTEQLTKCSICQDTSKSNAFVKCEWCSDWVVHSFCIPDLIGRRKRFWICQVCVGSCAGYSD